MTESVPWRLLLGPQRPAANVGSAIAEVTKDDEPIAIISAAWQEAEGDIGDVQKLMPNPLHDLNLYQRADLMFNPSLVDNMPISILEALACGVPVVSTNVGGVPYLVEDERTALLVPPGDAKALASAGMRLLENDAMARAMSSTGIAMVQQYAWPAVRKQLFSVYDDLLTD